MRRSSAHGRWLGVVAGATGASVFAIYERQAWTAGRRAAWQTVLMVMFCNKMFCRAAYHAVSYRDTQEFRRVCILPVLIPLLLVLAILKAFDSEPLADAVEHLGAWFIALIYLCLLLTLLPLTDLPSYFFCPQSVSIQQENCAIALRYYRFAVLTWNPLLVISLIPAFARADTRTELDVLLSLLVLSIVALVLSGAVVRQCADGVASAG